MVTEVAIIKAVSPTVRLFVTKVEIIIGCAAARPFLEVLYNQLAFCQNNQDAIIKKANKLYVMISESRANYQLRKRCCDFRQLVISLILPATP